jgi:hypothetical protein
MAASETFPCSRLWPDNEQTEWRSYKIFVSFCEILLRYKLIDEVGTLKYERHDCSASTREVKRNRHFPATGWNCCTIGKLI